MNYYGDISPTSAAWMRQLVAEKLIPPGEVDERPIDQIKPAELKRFTQCHFFAGIAGWPLALQIAGWPEDRPVWTGSCPCQPFSAAGLGLADKDARHRWPFWERLIRECAPPVVFGEQVASPAALLWLDGVFADLENAHYACGASDLCAAGIGAPHIRQRLYWVANAKLARRSPTGTGPEIEAGREPQPGRFHSDAAVGVGNPDGCELAQRKVEPDGQEQPPVAGAGRESGRVSFWSDALWHLCTDGKIRRISPEPEVFPVADGLPYKLARRRSARAALLKGSGDAIVPELAAEFIRAYLQAEQDLLCIASK